MAINKEECDIISNIIKFIVAPAITIISGWVIYKTTRRHNAIKEFRNTFFDERYKITTSRAVQDIGLQENAIRKLDGIISADKISAIRNLWKDYKKAEDKCKKAIPSPGTTVIHYGNHSPKILTKIDKIINYLK